MITPKFVVTPKVRALADQITAGVVDRREQAKKIYEWVSAHIRYVGIEIGIGGLVPHDADVVISNSYGDCKDHALLFSMLLKAKGISSEFVLINYGNSYTLPDTAVLTELNHAITWLPEFGLYADTTAQVAPFGVLPFEEYGKPVVHVASAGTALRRTPILPSGLASLTTKTVEHLDSKGNISGDTTTTASGPFAIVLRQTGLAIQGMGPERAAAQQLASMRVQGSGNFDVGSPSELSSDYTLKSQFVLTSNADIMAGRRFEVPSGLFPLGVPGDGLMGPLFNTKVTDLDATPCYSGHVVEDRLLDLPAGMHFAALPPDTGIKTSHLSFTTHWSVSGNTVTQHRDFTTTIDMALCTGDIRKETAKGLAQIRDSFSAGVAIASVQTGPVLSQDVIDAFQAADTAYKAGRYGDAVKLLGQTLSKGLPPDMRFAVFSTRGYAYLGMEELDKARADFAVARRLKPNDASPHLGRAASYVIEGKIDDAIAAYGDATHADPSNADVYDLRGLAYQQTGRLDLAMADFDELLRRKPDYVEGFLHRAWAHDGLKQFDLAIQDYDRVIALAPTTDRAFFGRGTSYLSKNDGDQALRDFTEAVRLNPNDSYSYNNRGIIYMNRGDLDLALQDFDRSIAINPNNNLPFQNRSAVYAKKGDKDRSSKDSERAAEIKAQLFLQSLKSNGPKANPPRCIGCERSLGDMISNFQRFNGLP